MLRTSAWKATDTLTRAQLQMVQQLGSVIRLSEEDRRRALRLSGPDWQAWTNFLSDDGPLPANPLLPDMLLRLGEVAFNLSRLAETRSGAAGCQ